MTDGAEGLTDSPASSPADDGAGSGDPRPSWLASPGDRRAEGETVLGPDADHAATLASLRESETRHRLVMRATNDIIWDADLIAGTALWSGAIEEILGYPDRRHHDDVWWRSSIHPEDRDRVLHDLDRALGDPDRSQFETEYRFRCLDGAYRTLLSRGLIIRDERGTAVRLVGSMMDYTEHKAAEIALVEARARAEAAQEAQARFLANISHELRTPLMSILGLADLLLDSDLDAQQHKWTATLSRSAERLQAIIDQFLDFTRTEAGFTALDPRPFDLTALLRQLEAEFAHLAAQKQVDLTVAKGDDVDSSAVGDELRLAQILQNLLSNAIKFTKQGHVRLRVLRHERDGAPALRFVVEDTGVGFLAESQASLFEPFRQADESVTREYGGTGLGLAICKQLADLMGGEITAESHPGEGSTFELVLPLAP